MASVPRLLAGRQGLAAAVLQQCCWQAPAPEATAAASAAAAAAIAAAQQRHLSSAAASTSGAAAAATTAQQQQQSEGATGSSASSGRAVAGGSSAAAAAAAAAAGPTGRPETIEEIRARVFGLHLGDNRRSGRKALLKPLRGKQIATWYFTMGMQPTPFLEDEMETDRLERIVADKASGRAPPKKGQGKRTGKK